MLVLAQGEQGRCNFASAVVAAGAAERRQVRRMTEAEAAALQQGHQRYLLRRLLGVRAATHLEAARKR